MRSFFSLCLPMLIGGCTRALLVPVDGDVGGGGAAGTGGGAGADAAAEAATDATTEATPDLPATITPSQPGQIVVTELMHDPVVVADDLGEWFEVYNPDATVTYDLVGCEIRDDNGNYQVIGSALPIPPHAFKTLAFFSGNAGGFLPDYTYGFLRFNNNTADAVNLTCLGNLIDRFAYTAADAATSGRSFSVDPAHTDAATNDTAGNYCLATDVYNQAIGGSGTVRDYGTPGAPNRPCP